MNERRIAVVEDEAIIAAAIAARLRREGFQVEIAADGPSGVKLCDRLRPDLVILDIMLPGFDGIEVCRQIQRIRPLPVLMLTARDSETDMLVGLGMGADDYMTKPFSPRELVARVHALLRRVQKFPAAPGAAVGVGNLEVDPSTRRVTRAGEVIHLTPIEFDLLYRLASHTGVVHTREQLMLEVWGYRDDAGARTVDAHVGALRKKLGPELVRTVHGIGYALEEPARVRS